MLGAIPASALAASCVTRRSESRITTLSTLDTNEVFDVCIAGSGFAGMVLACELVRRGVRTILLEAGGARDEAYRSTNVGFNRSPGSTAPAYEYPIESTRYVATGGTSRIWSGFCPRFRPRDFDPHPYSRGDGWPIAFGDVERYYAQAERELHVGAPSGKDRDELRVLTERLRSAGYTIEPFPLSSWKGDPINVAESHLPVFTQSPGATLVTDARVTKVVSEQDGAVSSFQVHSAAGLKKLVRAGVYVLASGGIETPRLLLLSRTSQFPDGIGNHSDHVGRNMMEHLQISGGGTSDTVATGDEPEEEEVESLTWDAYDELKAMGLGGILIEVVSSSRRITGLGLAPILEMEPSPWNRVTLDAARRDSFGNPLASVTIRMSNRDVATIRQAEVVMQRIVTDLGMRRSGGDLWVGMLHHHMGTCRMSADPAAGVVDRDLRVHGLDNLYLAGSAPFVTSSAAPPTLTIVALSLRLADHLVARLRGARREESEPAVGAAVAD
jgi:choline dehydrogenase-like flavoprotein